MVRLSDYRWYPTALRKLDTWVNANRNRRESAMQFAVVFNIVAMMFAANGYRRYQLTQPEGEEAKERDKIYNETFAPKGYIEGGEVDRVLQHKPRPLQEFRIMNDSNGVPRIVSEGQLKAQAQVTGRVPKSSPLQQQMINEPRRFKRATPPE